MNKFIELLCKLEDAACAKREVIIRKVTLSVAEPPSCGDDDVVIAENSSFYSTITIFVRAFEQFERNQRVPEFIRALAHEFRHLDQETAWDILPGVHVGVDPNTHRSSGWTYDKYVEDPGEADARDFAEKFLATITTDDVEETRQWLIKTLGSTLPDNDIVVFGK